MLFHSVLNWTTASFWIIHKRALFLYLSIYLSLELLVLVLLVCLFSLTPCTTRTHSVTHFVFSFAAAAVAAALYTFYLLIYFWFIPLRIYVVYVTMFYLRCFFAFQLFTFQNERTGWIEEREKQIVRAF